MPSRRSNHMFTLATRLTAVLSAASASDVPGASPNPRGLPGDAFLTQIIGGLAFYALGLSVAVLIGGAAVWAVGTNTGNPQWASNGKTAAVVAALAAVLVGAASALVRFFYLAGSAVS
jgi:hypothetical protein